ncbi:MAG: hypothetical protein U9O64_11525 [Campylobacterota bacterium]|nr:hypothetical protein [Campylobacterota bacterium]
MSRSIGLWLYKNGGGEAIQILNQLNLRFLYVEKFIHYDNTDFRIDLVDGAFVSCYDRKSSK